MKRLAVEETLWSMWTTMVNMALDALLTC